eukprot:TRINITY_DN8517_c0_g1_i2.p5 TRINITY_DN8517_c0_g1~~TRINITY_DN8517_c0_g1_i2.p5  ORF type:complete len:100 (+),score=29.24 TRINITY_DN8517_c0_g1_i2:615-914(+)
MLPKDIIKEIVAILSTIMSSIAPNLLPILTPHHTLIEFSGGHAIEGVEDMGQGVEDEEDDVVGLEVVKGDEEASEAEVPDNIGNVQEDLELQTFFASNS